MIENNGGIPQGLQTRGRAFWSAIMAVYELTGDSAELLLEVCRTLDTLANIDAVLTIDGPMIEGSKGQAVMHPALAEARASRVVLVRLVRALKLPPADELLAQRPTLHARGQAHQAASKAITALRTGSA